MPGGYVYITRQLMGLMNDESELGFVLGHEVGHIAANHAQARQSVCAAQFDPWRAGRDPRQRRRRQRVRQHALAGEQAAQLRTLSFSRDQEFQADVLGIRYVDRGGL